MHSNDTVNPDDDAELAKVVTNLARNAYTAYAEEVGWTGVNGDRLPSFDDPSFSRREAWECAAVAVIRGWSLYMQGHLKQQVLPR